MYLNELIDHIEKDLAHRNMIRIKNLNAITDLKHEIAEVDNEILQIQQVLSELQNKKDTL